MNEETPTLIINMIVIISFIMWVIYNSIVTNDPLLMNLIGDKNEFLMYNYESSRNRGRLFILCYLIILNISIIYFTILMCKAGIYAF